MRPYSNQLAFYQLAPLFTCFIYVTECSISHPFFTVVFILFLTSLIFRFVSTTSTLSIYQCDCLAYTIVPHPQQHSSQSPRSCKLVQGQSQHKKGMASDSKPGRPHASYWPLEHVVEIMPGCKKKSSISTHGQQLDHVTPTNALTAYVLSDMKTKSVQLFTFS